jgi:hypothetical protein
LKRFAAIVTIVVVVLAMSAGTAFANVCASGACDGRMTVCSETASTACPMDGGVATVGHTSCEHTTDRTTGDVASGQTAEHAVASAPLTLPAVAASGGPASVSPATDARGAPHLTAVIRI